MEEKLEEVVEETTQEQVEETPVEETPQIDESKFESAGDDSVVKVDLSNTPKTEKEDRKDERTKIQATQQSEMIEQRNSGKPPKNFESAGNDILGGGFDLGAFDPK